MRLTKLMCMPEHKFKPNLTSYRREEKKPLKLDHSRSPFTFILCHGYMHTAKITPTIQFLDI